MPFYLRKFMLNKTAENIISNLRLIKLLCNSIRRGYLKDIGWITSYKTDSSVDKNHNPIPWVTYSFIDFIEPRLNKTLDILEYGAGNSTLYYSGRVNNIFSIEHDYEWYKKIKKKCPQNAEIIHRKLHEYSNAVELLDKKFSIIIVDGRNRVNCIKHSLPYLSHDGVLILDDSERTGYIDGIEFMLDNGYKKIDFWGIAPGIFYKKCTSIFYKDKNCLGI